MNYRLLSIVLGGITAIPLFIYGGLGLNWIENFTGMGYAGWHVNDPIRDITFTAIPNSDVSAGYVIIGLGLIGMILYNLGYLMAKRRFHVVGVKNRVD